MKSRTHKDKRTCVIICGLGKGRDSKHESLEYAFSFPYFKRLELQITYVEDGMRDICSFPAFYRRKNL